MPAQSHTFRYSPMSLNRTAAWTTDLRDSTVDGQASRLRPRPTIEALFDAVQVCEISLGVTAWHQLDAWIRGPLNSLIPHFGLLIWSNGTDRSPGELRVFQGEARGLDSSRSPGVDWTRFSSEARRQWRLADRIPICLDADGRAVDVSSPAPAGLHYVIHGVQPLCGEPETLFALICDNRRDFERLMLLTRLIAPFLVLALHRLECVASSHKPAIAVRQSPAYRPVLTIREIRILECIWNGMTNAAIGSALEISPFTVKSHLQRVFRKLQVSTRTQAVAAASTLGILDLGRRTATSYDR